MLFIMIAVIYALYTLFFGKSFNTKKSVNKNELALETIVIEVQGGEFGFLKADITLEGVDKSASKMLQANQTQVRRLILHLVSQEDGRELLSEESKQALKEKIKKQIMRNLGINVANVYFRNFVLAK